MESDEGKSKGGLLMDNDNDRENGNETEIETDAENGNEGEGEGENGRLVKTHVLMRHWTSAKDAPAKDNVILEFFSHQFIYLLKKLILRWKHQVLIFAALLAVVRGLEEVAIYFVGLIASQYYIILTSSNPNALEFLMLCIFSTLKVLAVASLKSLGELISGWFALKVRSSLTDEIQTLYFSKLNYYKLNNIDKAIDNPDQRVADDVNKFSYELREIYTRIVIWPFLVAYYTYSCWKISGYISVLLIYCFFLVGAFVNVIVARLLKKAIFKQERMEGNFRFLQVNIKTHSEEIAFQDAAPFEAERSSKSFDDVLNNLKSVVNTTALVKFFSNLFSYLGSILSYMIVAIPVFAGNFTGMDPGEISGIISESSFINMYLIYTFTTILELADHIGAISGYTRRIYQLLTFLSDYESKQNYFEDIQNNSGINHKNIQDDHLNGSLAIVSQEAEISVDNVTISCPTGEILLTGVSFKVKKGENLLITGPSGSGKSSIFRVLRGLWKPYRGEIILPKEKTIFLSQNPYLSRGCSLKDLVTYPSTEQSSLISDQELYAILTEVDLVYLIDREQEVKTHFSQNLIRNLEESREMVSFADTLSPGERQRLCFARIFFWRPQFAFLDEATSALDEEKEEKLYQLCAQQNITLITIGHRSSLLKLHHNHIDVMQFIPLN